MAFISTKERKNLFNKIYGSFSTTMMKFFCIDTFIFFFLWVIIFCICILSNINGKFEQLDVINHDNNAFTPFGLSMTVIVCYIFIRILISILFISLLIKSHLNWKKNYIKLSTASLPGKKSLGTMTKNIKDRLIDDDTKDIKKF